jgi:RNA polymerase sigma-B factor
VARRYVGRGEALEDLVQVGSVGLIKASSRFDESRGVAFATFATPAIEGEIRHHLRDRSSVLRIPRALQRTSRELRQRRERLAAALGHSPTVAEIASALDADEQNVERALRAELARQAVPLSPEDDAGELARGSDLQIPSEDRLSLARSVRALDERQRAIVFLRFHLDMTERQIGRELGISQAHVSRLLSSALSRLRADLGAPNEGKRELDTTAGEVVSATFGSAPAVEKDRTRERSQAKVPRAVGRIGPVPTSDENRTAVADYLQLPYSVGVRSEREGGEIRWCATVEELPGCAARADTPDEAVDLVREAMEPWLATALAEGREIPVPAGEPTEQRTAPSHSGRFLVRMPGTLHAQLAGAAEREQLSLNRFVTKVLASSVSPTQPAQPRAAMERPEGSIDPAPGSKRKPPRALRVALATNLAVVMLAGLAAVVLLVLALQTGF